MSEDTLGRFTNYPIADLDTDSEREEVTENTETEDIGLERVREWWDYDVDGKQAVADEFEQIELLQNDRHWEMSDSLGKPLRTAEQMSAHPNVVENVAWPLIEGLVSEFSQDVELIDYPQESTDDQAAKTMTQVKKHILYKNAFPEEQAKWLHNFAWKGTGIYGVSWDAEWRGGRGPNQWIGEVRIESIDPELIYPDHRCGADIQDGYRIHKAVWRPLEYIRQHYPERGHLVLDQAKADETSQTNTNWERDLGLGEADSPEGMARLVETWYIGKPLFPSKDSQVDPATETQSVEGDVAPDDTLTAGMVAGDVESVGEADEETPSDDEVGLHVVWWIAEQNIYLAHRNFIYFDPEETPEFPFVFAQCYPRRDSPWGFGEGHKLINPQQMLNKLSEVAMEGAALQALGVTLASEEAISEEQRRDVEMYGSIPGMWFFINDANQVQHVDGKGVPASVLNDINRRKQHMEAVIGRYDITQGKTPANVTAFRALNLLAERAQVRLRPKESSISSALVKVSKWISRMVCLYWTEPRAYRILGKDDDPATATYSKFEPSRIWKVWDRRTGNSFERGVWRPAEDMVEGEDYEYFWPELDTRCTVTRAQSTDRYFAMELAQDMVGRKYFPPEILFYAIEHGRLPPWDDIKDKVQPQFDRAQPMPGGASQGAPQGMPPGMPQGMAGQPQPPELTPEALIAMLPPEQQAQFQTMTPDQQQAVLEEMAAATQGGAQGGGPSA